MFISYLQNANSNIHTSLKRYRCLHISGFLCALCFTYLAAASQAYGESTIIDLFAVSLSVGLLTLFICMYYYRKQRPLPLKAIIFWACIFRLIGVFSYPLLEDDHYRFLWDGYQTVTTGSPYTASPIDFFNADLSEELEDILGSINYPEVPTIYAPVTQAIFAIAYIIAPVKIWALKFILLVFDISLLLVLSYLVGAIAKNHNSHSLMASWHSIAFLFFSWSPLVIKETAFTAHPDVIGVFFIVSAWALHYLQPKRPVLLAVLCALAVASKIFALLLVPFLLQFSWRKWLVFFIALIAMVLPFGKDLLQFIQSVQTMGAHWIFNAPIYLLFDYYVMSFPQYFSASSYATGMRYIKYIGLSLFVVFWGGYFFRFFHLSAYCMAGIAGVKRLLCNQAVLPESLPRGDWIYGLFFLVIPVVNPWYLLWLLPFSVIYPSLWALVASFSVLLSYVIGLNVSDPSLADYGQPGWALTIEYMLIVMAFFGEKLWLRNHYVDKKLIK